MRKFGKNDWKIRMYKIVSGVVVVGAIGAATVFGVPKIMKSMEKEDIEPSATQTVEAKPEDTMEVIEVESTPTSEPTQASLISSEPDLSACYRVPVIAANASSTITQQGTDNSPMLLFDDRDDTSWQEGVNGYGINENIAFSFDTAAKVKYIGFKLGNWKNDKYYFGNAKPKTLTLVFGEYSGQVTFTGERKVEWVEVNHALNSDSMRITINDVYPGTSWEDTCISEIMVYAER
ncbi:MAG: NADase-type glycan-binding domain-containing protein [Blautia wexlerae]